MKLMIFNVYAAVAVFVYFLVMIVFTHFQIDFIGLRFVIELLTIPMFLLIAVILFLSVRYYNRDTNKARLALLFLLLTIGELILGSLFDIY